MNRLAWRLETPVEAVSLDGQVAGCGEVLGQGSDGNVVLVRLARCIFVFVLSGA